jgi:stage V sporulation protein AC
MKMTKADYKKYAQSRSPSSTLWPDVLKAFLSGGLICCIGQGIQSAWATCTTPDTAASATSITLIFLGAVLTGMGVYDNLARFSGAGTLVPITGFANSVVSPALEFKAEGLVTGMAAKMFIIAGPVIVFGISASVLYGLILCLFGLA